MRWLQATWAARFNRFRGESGRPFQGRYKALHVEPGHALAQVAHYIHLNPVVAQITPSAENWRWSSAAAYLGAGDRRTWLKTELILELFGPEDANAAYRDFMAAGNDQGTTEFYAAMGW